MKSNFQTNFNTITNILILSVALFGGFVWADTNGVWSSAGDIRGGIFGSDEQDVTSYYAFANPLTLNSNFTITNAQNCSKLYTNVNGVVLCGEDLDSEVGNEYPIAGDGISVSGRTVSVNEGSLFPTCESNEYLTYNGTNLRCIEGSGVGSGTYEGPLYNNIHNGTQCVENFGVVVTLDGEKVCKFQSSCPSGWTQFKDWTATTSNSCSASNCDSSDMSWWNGRPHSCSVSSSHTFSDNAGGSCAYFVCGCAGCGCCRGATCKEKIIEAACY